MPCFSVCDSVSLQWLASLTMAVCYFLTLVGVSLLLQIQRPVLLVLQVLDSDLINHVWLWVAACYMGSIRKSGRCIVEKHTYFSNPPLKWNCITHHRNISTNNRSYMNQPIAAWCKSTAPLPPSIATQMTAWQRQLLHKRKIWEIFSWKNRPSKFFPFLSFP